MGWKQKVILQRWITAMKHSPNDDRRLKLAASRYTRILDRLASPVEILVMKCKGIYNGWVGLEATLSW